MSEMVKRPARKPARKMSATERAARDVLNAMVREGEIDRWHANRVLKFALPFVPGVLARARLSGWDPDDLHAYFQEKLADAVARRDAADNDVRRHMARGRVAAVRIYIAMWAGLRVDYARFVEALREAGGGPVPLNRAQLPAEPTYS
ncbi:hypothetical protein ACFC1T_09165 [Kitasatospora sp. NPDC056076]|uniref:hypothetical protein n=1 Tax=Kitasatospora sp. NPDC056076 TaxID=3345703 RepID=UPI0035DC690A